MKKTLLMCFAIVYGCQLVSAQSRLVQGRVFSATDNQPLAGVNVIIQGTTIGVATNADGEFSLQANEGDVLVFSFIGYASQEVALTGQLQLEVSLEEDITTLRAVTIVSTGYQDLPKERATGSFVQVDQSLVNRRVSTDVLSRIEDVASGLIFNRNVPGRENDISIRGTSTIFSNTQPLIVIDNFPYDGELSALNPNDVESITVLKDAAAASIWGARAGNGVIVITTKKGKESQPLQASFNANVTVVEQPDLHYLQRMSSADVIGVEQMLFDRGHYSGAETSVSHAPLTPAVELMIANRDGLITEEELETALEELRQRDVRDDFEQYLYRQSVKQQYAINLSGGGEANRYFVSAGWDRNLESLIGNQYDRITLNANNTWSALRNKLEIGAAIYYTETETVNNNPGHDAIHVLPTQGLYPYARLKDDAGNNLPIIKDYRAAFVQQSEANGLLNWDYKPLDEISIADNTRHLTDYRINTRLGYTIVEGLKAEVLYQYWRATAVRRNHQSMQTYYVRNLINRFTQDDGTGTFLYPIPLGGILDNYVQESRSHNVRGQVTYTKAWNDHELNALAGYEVKELKVNSIGTRYYGYNDELASSQAVDYMTFFDLYDRPSTLRIPNADSHNSLTDRFISWYGNAAYTFRNRYTVSVSARKDQSNLFGVKSNQRGVPLWSAGAGWNISDEAFYQVGAFPYVKVRATYGFNGNINKNVTAFTTARRIGTDSYSGLPYGTILNPPNEELRWERVKVINLGVDFRMRNNAVNGSIEYYTKRGLDLIGSTPFAPSTGITEFTGNTANTKGHGFDVVLNTLNINRAVKWNTNVLFSNLVEKVSSYELKDNAFGYLVNGSGSSEMISPLEGKPLYAIYSYRWAGLDPETGDPRSYLNGVPSADYSTISSSATPDSLVYHGSARPTVFGAVRNAISWKNFSLSVNLSYRFGYYFRRNSVRYVNVLQGNVDHGDFSKRWENPGDEMHTDVPSMPDIANSTRDNIYLYSEALVEKGDHIRLQDVNLTYTLNKQSWRRLPLRKVEVYVYGNNLGLIWKATKADLDPDYPTLKPMRSVAAGLRIEF